MEEILLKKFVEGPTQLDFLTILKSRCSEVFLESERLYNSLHAGEMGEQEVVRFFQQHGREHWRFIRNYWADLSGTFESDLILITRHLIYVIEVKNYTGIFKYNEGLSTIDGADISSNCVFQARRSSKNLRKMLSALVGANNVRGALVFVGANNEVHIQSHVEDIEIVQRNQLMRFVQKIVAEEDAMRYGKSIDVAAVVSRLKQFQTGNPFTFEPVTEEQMMRVRTGIRCADCGRFSVDVSRKFVKCQCGCVELRDEAMVRTICEYGVLRFDDQLRVKELMPFFGDQTSLRYLNYILATHFTMVKMGKNTYYENHTVPYHRIGHNFSYY